MTNTKFVLVMIVLALVLFGIGICQYLKNESDFGMGLMVSAFLVLLVSLIAISNDKQLKMEKVLIPLVFQAISRNKTSNVISDCEDCSEELPLPDDSRIYYTG